MGLGKTLTGSEKMHELGAKENLVVCQKSKIDDWVEHFEKYYPNVIVDNLTTKAGWDDFIPYAGVTSTIHVGIINYDLVWRRKELLKSKDFTLMLDESSLIQNEQAKRSEFILKLKPKNVILLSGTPTGGKYEKLWSQLHLLGWSISKKMFYNHYVDYHWDDSEGFPRMVIDGYKNEERLKRKMREYGCHFLKTDEVFDLPEQIHQTIKVDTSKEYRTFRKDSIVIIDNVELVGDTTLTKMLYERQLCGQYNEAKIKAFSDLVESTEDRLIVFYNFIAELETLKQVLEPLERPYSLVNGSAKDLQAYEEKSDSVTFIQYQAGAMGLNLQKANKIIYFTPPLSSELFEQSKKRIHRIGQTNTCFYYYLTCKNSIEQKIYATLKMRKDYTEYLFEEGE
jgi:SNF2 family DNA or RNA helicase